jgi:hypothetical protein
MFWKTKKTQKIELTENGFQIIYNKDFIQFEWKEIQRLTGFKIDKLTIDDICLKIESENNIFSVTEEFVGWRLFINQILIEFPEIDKNWEGKVALPPFERKETELYKRKNVG